MRFLKKLLINISSRAVVRILFDTAPTASILLLKICNVFSGILDKEVIKVYQQKIDIYHILIFLSFICSSYLYYINLIKPYITNKKRKYLVEYQNLKWLIEKHYDKYTVSEIPFCFEHEIECVYQFYVHLITSMYCPICKKPLDNNYLFNKNHEIYNIINSKGLKYFIHKKFKGKNEIAVLSLEYHI